jgi:hypothetical protein
LGYASDELKADKEVVTAAVKITGGAALQYASEYLHNDALLERLCRMERRGQRNWHICRLKFRMRECIARWCARAAQDAAHFDANGNAVLVGRGALAAKRKWGELAAF